MNFEIINNEKDGLVLSFLYKTTVGRLILKLLINEGLSNYVGRFLDSKYSLFLIKPFCKINNINLNDYVEYKYKNFNEFFYRQIKLELRPIDYDSKSFICPSDGYLSVYKINKDSLFSIKGSIYSVNDLLQDEELSKEYENGTCLIFRLCVHHYHRYHFIDDGRIIEHKIIKGKYHTVRPIAIRNCKIFKENTREYSLIETDNFGKIIQMEVGAMLVGKIDNIKTDISKKGEQKGKFLYGGSTIVVLVKDNNLALPEWMFEVSEDNKEISVQMGMKLN